MAAHTAAASFTSTTYAISAGLPATYDAAGYGATTITYTTIGKVESFPEIGATREVNKFTPINGAVEYLKGTAEYGSGDMVMADVPADAPDIPESSLSSISTVNVASASANEPVAIAKIKVSTPCISIVCEVTAASPVA